MNKPTFVASMSGLAVIAGGLALAAAPASAQNLNIGDGEAVVLLSKCNDGGKSQSTNFADGCSYTYLKGKSPTAAPYTYLASDGAVTWNQGNITAGDLTFPADGQTWPKITGLAANATSESKPKEITGKVNERTGEVTLDLTFETDLIALGKTCTLTGQATLTSDGTESMGGAKGSNYNPETGTFAVVSTSPATVTASGAACSTLNLLYNLDAGMGWYIAGQIGLPGGKEPIVPVPDGDGGTVNKEVQNADVKTPRKIRAKGKTVILRSAVTTNADQKASSKVTWSTKKSAKGTSKKYASVKTTSAGKVTINTTGKAKKLFVKLVTKAPATDQFQAFSYTRTWVVKK